MSLLFAVGLRSLSAGPARARIGGIARMREAPPGVLAVARGRLHRHRLELGGDRWLREGPQLVRGEAERGGKHDGGRLTGKMPGAGSDQREQEELVRAEREPRDEECAGALAEERRAGRLERPRAVPGVVARRRDEERDGRGGEIVETGAEQS